MFSIFSEMYNQSQRESQVSGANSFITIARKRMLFAMGLLLPMILGLTLPVSKVAAQAAPIKLGVLLSFTGPAAISAASYWPAIRMAVKEINDAGGLLGRKVEIVQADDQSNPAQAVSEARRLAQLEKVNFVMGPGASGLALAVAPVFNEAKIVYFSTSVAVIPTPYNFSPMMSTSAYVQPMVKFMKDNLRARNVAVLSDNGAASKATVEDFKKQIPGQGMNLIMIQEHDTRPTDITPQLLSIKRSNPDVLVHTTSYGEDAGLLIKSMAEMGWNIPVMSAAAGLAAGATLKIAGPDAFKSERIYSPVPLAHTYCASDKPGSRNYDRYVSRLKAFEPENFDKIDQKSSLYLYDALQLLKAAIEGTKSLDGATLVGWMDQNATKQLGTAGAPFASTTGSHFMMGADSMAIVKRPDLVRQADKLVERVTGC